MSIVLARHPAGPPPAGPLTAGSLCSGYGGLDLAVMAVTGARLAWWAETDRYAAAVLKHHWPGVPNLGDVTSLDWAKVPPVDLVSAGWPCQDISYAGPGAGITEPAVASGSPSPPAFAAFDPATSTWRTSPRSARAASDESSETWPRSGMTRSGRAFALPTPEPRTAAIASSSSPSGPAQPQGSRLLPTPVAGNFNDGASLPAWQGRRDRQKKLGRNGIGIGTPLPVAIALLPTPLASDSAPEGAGQVGGTRPSVAKRQTGLPEVIIHRLASQDSRSGTAEPGEGRLLPTPDTGCSPNGHGRRGGRPGNGHQSGAGLDVTATALSPTPAPRAGQGTVAWGEYEPAVRRWENVLGCPAPPPAEPGPSGRPRLSAAFAEWRKGPRAGVRDRGARHSPYPPAEDHRQRRRPPAGRRRAPAADRSRRPGCPPAAARRLPREPVLSARQRARAGASRREGAGGRGRCRHGAVRAAPPRLLR